MNHHRETQQNQSMQYSDRLGRKFSMDSVRTSGTKRKVNSVIKIAAYITNKKFQDKRKADDTASYMANKKSAFKLIDKPYRNISLDTKKMINYKDFFEILKDKNIIKPVPVRKEGDYRSISKKRGRDQEQSVDFEKASQAFKRRRLEEEQSVFSSSINNINRLRNMQREDVSMHSINTVLASYKEKPRVIVNDDVSMHIRPETRSILSKSLKSKTLDEIKKEIEMKRGANKKMIDEISRKSSRRADSEGVFDYEEKKRILNTYYKEKEKSMKEFELGGASMIKPSIPPSAFDLTKDKNFSLTKSNLSIPSSKRDVPVVMEKKEQIEIYPKSGEGKATITTPALNTPIAALNAPSTTGGLFGVWNKLAPTELPNSEVKLPEATKKVETKPCLFSFGEDKRNQQTEKKELEKETEKKGEEATININLPKKTDEVSQLSIVKGLTPGRVGTSGSLASPETTTPNQPLLFANKTFGGIKQPETTTEPNKETLFGTTSSSGTNIVTPTFGKAESKPSLVLFKKEETKKEEPVTSNLFGKQEKVSEPAKEISKSTTEEPTFTKVASPFSGDLDKSKTEYKTEAKPTSQQTGSLLNITPTTTNPFMPSGLTSTPSSLFDKKVEKKEEKKEEPKVSPLNIPATTSATPTASFPFGAKTEAPKAEMTTATSSSSNLCTSDNPFIKASINPKSTNSMFSSSGNIFKTGKI